jgi:Zn-dependent alcohol dehydrogenase
LVISILRLEHNPIPSIITLKTLSVNNNTSPTMSSSQTNQAAWIDEKATPLRVAEAPFPVAGAGEVIIESRAVAVNPLDWHMQDWGVFIQQWPSIFGGDVAGVVHKVGEGVTKFKPGDRVIA